MMTRRMNEPADAGEAWLSVGVLEADPETTHGRRAVSGHVRQEPAVSHLRRNGAVRESPGHQ
jgi:hypothetical protein